MEDRICSRCKKVFTPSSRHKCCPRCRYYHKKKPCPTCGTPISFVSDMCISCFNKSRVGENNPNWKNGKTYSQKGYVYIQYYGHPRTRGGYVAEHVLVMERKIGRHLIEGENVHHINGIKDDNRPENLELWVKPQPSGIRQVDAVNWAVEIIKRYNPELLK